MFVIFNFLNTNYICLLLVKPTTPQPATFSIGSSRDEKAKTELKIEKDSKILLERLNEEGKINHLFNFFNLAPSKLNTAKLSSDSSFNWLIFLQLNIEFTNKLHKFSYTLKY